MMNFRPFRHTDVADIILSILATFQPDTYLELGTQRGHVFNRAVKYVQKCAVGVDIIGFNHIIHTPPGDPTVLLFQCTTSDFFSAVVEKLPPICTPFDVIFIDADHSYEAVSADLQGAWHLIAPVTGIILAHDTYPTNTDLVSPRYCGEAWRAVRDFKDRMGAECECVTLPGPWAGMSIIRRVAPGKPIHWQITA